MAKGTEVTLTMYATVHPDTPSETQAAGLRTKSLLEHDAGLFALLEFCK